MRWGGGEEVDECGDDDGEEGGAEAEGAEAAAAAAWPGGGGFGGFRHDGTPMDGVSGRRRRRRRESSTAREVATTTFISWFIYIFSCLHCYFFEIAWECRLYKTACASEEQVKTYSLSYVYQQSKHISNINTISCSIYFKIIITPSNPKKVS
jgi:hypothetical protein